MGKFDAIAIATVACGAVALLLSILLVATKRLHGRLSMDTAAGIHKFHVNPTPRIGGIAIACGLLIGWAAIHVAEPISSSTVKETSRLFGKMLLAGTPAFVFGILEDITKRIGVRVRLFATMASGLLACFLTGTMINTVDLWGVDNVLALTPIAALFTAFAVGGVANSFNIIDGFNGLAAGALLLSLAAIGTISAHSGDITLATVCMLIAASVIGFGLVNFPFGRIFLGDGGAYLLGFLVAWSGVMLPARNPDVSPWAALLACGYPVLEVIFSIWRKHFRAGSHPGQPDRVHLHMLIYKRVSRRYFAHARPELQNGFSSLFVWAYALVPTTISVVFQTSTIALILGFASSAVLYRTIYVRLTQFRWSAVVKSPYRKVFSSRHRQNRGRELERNVA
jgi:UDP-N-acetylmuramyl pentapeptide phosphotransferase/UDP-N-acetylglucosamine-1-phosphate transferase